MGDPGNGYQQLLADLYGYLAYQVGSQAEAEELTNATIESASREAGVFSSSPERTRVSLLTIAHRCSAGSRDGERPAADHPGMSVELADALAQLQRRERSVLALSFGARLTGRDTAVVLGLDEEDVRRLLSRGLRRLRTELERHQRRDEEHGEP